MRKRWLSYMSMKRNKATTQNYFQKKEENLMEWVGYWRKNPHIFASEHLGMKGLFLYQKILLYMMNKYDFFMYIAARGQK